VAVQELCIVARSASFVAILRSGKESLYQTEAVFPTRHDTDGLVSMSLRIGLGKLLPTLLRFTSFRSLHFATLSFISFAASLLSQKASLASLRSLHYVEATQRCACAREDNDMKMYVKLLLFLKKQ
jgi:hypothetical protein